MNLIARYLAREEMTQSAFAGLVGVSQPTVHAWVNGTSAPTGDRLVRVAGLLGITVAEALGHFHLPVGSDANTLGDGGSTGIHAASTGE
jgi:transcriptional regulator with XRE-family HTH domain